MANRYMAPPVTKKAESCCCAVWPAVGKTSDEKLLDLASVQKGGMVIMDNGTNSMGTHTKGGLFKTFIEQLSSSTISRGQRCPEAMLALYTNEQPGVIKDEAVLTHVTAIRMPQVIVVWAASNNCCQSLLSGTAIQCHLHSPVACVRPVAGRGTAGIALFVLDTYDWLGCMHADIFAGICRVC